MTNANGKEAIAIIDILLSQKEPGKSLNDLQELIFCQSWEGKSYQEIADRYGYEGCAQKQLVMLKGDRN